MEAANLSPSLLQVDFISSSIHQCLNATVQHIQVGMIATAISHNNYKNTVRFKATQKNIYTQNKWL